MWVWFVPSDFPLTSERKIFNDGFASIQADSRRKRLKADAKQDSDLHFVLCGIDVVKTLLRRFGCKQTLKYFKIVCVKQHGNIPIEIHQHQNSN